MRSVVLACAALLACGRGQPPAGSRANGDRDAATATRIPRPAFLRRVPADTPYAFAALAPMPADYFDREYLSRVRAWQPLAEGFARLRRDKADKFARLTVSHRLGAALVAELGNRRGGDALEAVGLDRTPRWILYGAGASPVVRVELRDRERAAAALDRVLAWLAPVERRTLGGIAYRAVNDGARRWVFAIAQGELVVAILSVERFDAELPIALAAREPAESLASERTLERVAGAIGAAAWSLGYVDTERLAAHGASRRSAACGDELPALASLAPRISFGARSASDRQVHMVSLVELRRDVAAALDAMRGEMPGPDPDSQQPASLILGLAVDLARVTTVLDDTFDRINARPYACDALAGLNRLAKDQGANLGWIAASPFGKVDGITALLFAGDPPATGGTGPRPPAGGVVLLGTEQPAALLQSIAGLLPIGLPTKLNPGDAPVAVGGGVGLPLSPIHVALGKRALGFAAGGHQTELAELLAATPAAESPLFYLGMHVRELASLFGSNRADPLDPALAELDPDLAARLAAIEGASLDRFEELSIRGTATPRGLELTLSAHYAR